MRDTFGIVPERVLDPVFAVDPKIFDDLMKTSRAAKEREGKKEPFLCTYILDPTEAKREALLYVAGEKNLPMVHMLDGYTENFEANKKALDLDGIVEDRKVETGSITFPTAISSSRIPATERASRFCSASPLSASETPAEGCRGLNPWPVFFIWKNALSTMRRRLRSGRIFWNPLITEKSMRS